MQAIGSHLIAMRQECRVADEIAVTTMGDRAIAGWRLSSAAIRLPSQNLRQQLQSSYTMYMNRVSQCCPLEWALPGRTR